MTDRITYLYAAWFLALAMLAFALVHQRAEVLRLRDELAIVGAKIPVYAQSNDEMAQAADEATKRLAACEEKRKAGR